ncbi:MAG TPA: hypothetical protein VNN15_03460 [Solirubrobacterales bacterium]|nr:hypothetical protein [Solirubrobacterales bacterium]
MQALRGNGRRRLVVSALVLSFALISVAAAVGERPSFFADGKTQMAVDALLVPHKLPPDQPSVAELTFATRVSAEDGGHPPSLRKLLLETDSQVFFDLKKVPVCRYRRNVQPSMDWDRCSRAAVGMGMIEFEIAFPEQSAIAGGGNVLVYNGGLVNGKRRLWLRFPLSVPTESVYVEPLDISQVRSGPYRTRLALTIGEVAGGSGLLKTLSLRLKKGVFGSCPTGRLLFQATGIFADGTHPAGQLSRRCYRS